MYLALCWQLSAEMLASSFPAQTEDLLQHPCDLCVWKWTNESVLRAEKTLGWVLLLGVMNNHQFNHQRPLCHVFVCVCMCSRFTQLLKKLKQKKGRVDIFPCLPTFLLISAECGNNAQIQTVLLF